MKNKGSWVAAGLFFCAGCFLVAVPSVVRAMLFAALWGAKIGFDHAMIEEQVPVFLYGFAGVAFVLAVFALVLPERPSAPGDHGSMDSD